MFKPLLTELAAVYTGDIIYLPTPVYRMVEQWIESLNPHSFLGARWGRELVWQGKKVLPFEEEDLLKAYQATPIHVPERILEKSIVIETTLTAITSTTPTPEPPPERKEKPTRQPCERRQGTKTKPFNQLF